MKQNDATFTYNPQNLRIPYEEPSEPRENTVITCISKLKGWLIRSVISRLQIDEIEKIQQCFQAYDFDFQISNWATRITCFTFSTFLLLTVPFLRIFYEIENLKKNVKVRIRKSWGLYIKVASFCLNMFFFVSLGSLGQKNSYWVH